MIKRISCVLLLVTLLVLLGIGVNAGAAVETGEGYYADPGIWTFICSGVIVGLIVSVITGICIIVSYKKKLRSATYPLNRYARLDLKRRDERFMGSFVTRRVIQRQSGNGGRGGRSRGRR